MPLSLLQTAITARYLGPTLVGYIYIGVAFNAFGFLAVDWGQTNALQALVATHPSQAGRLLGASLAWRGAASVAVSAVLFAASFLLRYEAPVRITLVWVSLGFCISALSNACQLIAVGFERTDIPARRQVLEQLLGLIAVTCVLVMGGKVVATLAAIAAVNVMVLVYVSRALRATGLRGLGFDWATFRMLLRRGTPFVFYGLAMVFQPYVDTLFLSKLAPDSVGWYGAARRLLGVLIFPATAVGGAIYPTLCRLHATDADGFKAAMNGALRAISMIVVPVGLGCALFPEIGASVYGRDQFEPTADNLRVLSIFLTLMFLSVPIGCSLLAAGKERQWTFVQVLCIGVSVVLDPLLIPWFQKHYGNGGLGVCWTSGISEGLVVTIGMVLMPAGAFGPSLWKSLVRAGAAGLSMVAVAKVLSSVNAFVVAPLAVVAYAGTLWMVGGVGRSETELLRGLVRRKFWGSVTPDVVGAKDG